MVIIRIRNGFIYSREKISLQNLFCSDMDTYKTVLTRFYMDSNLIPPLIIMPVKPSNSTELLNLLIQERGARVRFEYPKIGEKAKEVTITAKNAELLLSEWIIKKIKYKEESPSILLQLQSDLNLEVPPKNIEVFLKEGSSIDQESFLWVKDLLKTKKVMVILDSHHSHDHVLKELELYAPIVPQNGYLICGDTSIERQPLPPSHRKRPWGPGNNPATALKEYLSKNPNFQIDLELENKLLMTNNYRGYLYRTN